METKKNTRLLSLDTLRGFDMLFIMGFAPLVVALNALHPTAVGDVIAGHMRHVPWDGFTQHDMIFPPFLLSQVYLSRFHWPSKGGADRATNTFT